jgi:hypothetical protein
LPTAKLSIRLWKAASAAPTCCGEASRCSPDERSDIRGFATEKGLRY